MGNLSAAIQNALSSLQAHSTRHNATAHNVANVATTGFKRHGVQFASMVSDRMAPGDGVQAKPRIDYLPGVPIASGSQTDLAISGQGYFAVEGSDGSVLLTRSGAFQKDANGLLRDSSGRALLGYAGDGEGGALQPVQIDPAAESFSIGQDGRISVVGPDGTSRVAYTIPVGSVVGENGLEAVNGTAFQNGQASGDIQYNLAGNNGAGTVLSGFLESSNVDLAQETTDSMTTRHAYSANVATIRTADQMTQSLLDIKS